MDSMSNARIRIYEMIEGQRLSSLLDYPLSHFGTCPNVGDTLCLDLNGMKFFSVSRRYYVNLIGWAIVVRKVPPSPQIDSVIKAWQEDDDWDAELDAEEEAAREKVLQKEVGRRAHIFEKTPGEFALDNYEEPVIKRLVKIGIDKAAPISALRGLGESTRNKLERRGFITVELGHERMDSNMVKLTSAGAQAWKSLLAYRKKMKAAKAPR